MMNDLQKQVIITYAKNDMCIDRTAKAMHYRRSTIGYHIERIRTITGLNPRNFFDMIKLYEMAIGGHINGN